MSCGTSSPTSSGGRLDRRGIDDASDADGEFLGLERVTATADTVFVVESRVVPCFVTQGRSLEDGA